MNDVESPIDLRNLKDALEWQETVNVKRPWRKDFFDYYVDLIRPCSSEQCQILELGSGPGFLAHHLLSQLPNIEYTAFDFSAVMHQLAQKKHEQHMLLGVLKTLIGKMPYHRNMTLLSSIRRYMSYAIKDMRQSFIKRYEAY